MISIIHFPIITFIIIISWLTYLFIIIYLLFW